MKYAATCAACCAASCAAFCATMGWGSFAHASPQDVVGFGSRATAMGGTGVASSDGVDAVYANPSLLSLSHDIELQLGLMGASFDLSATGEGLGGAELPSYPSLRANTLGGVLPLPFKGALDGRLAIGFGFLTPLDVVVRGRILYPEKPQYLLADRTQSVAVQASLGADLGYGVRVGVGVTALAALTGSVLVATDASGRIGTVVDDTLVMSYAPIIGGSYDISDDYRAGLTFRGVLSARFNVVISAKNLGQIEIPPLNISGVPQYDPWQVAAEVARVSGDLRVALGVTYKHWPDYPGPVEATVRCEDAPPDSDCNTPLVPHPDFSATVTPRLGAEQLFHVQDVTLSARAGYAFEPASAPEQTGQSSYYDNHRSIFSVGSGMDLGEVAPVRFDAFMQLQWLHSREHQRVVADGAALGGMVTAGGDIVAGGTSATVRF